MNVKEKNANLRCGLLDFQVGECHDSIPFDPAEYVKASAEAGIQTLIFIGKDAYGCAFYDSDLNIPKQIDIIHLY